MRCDRRCGGIARQQGKREGREGFGEVIARTIEAKVPNPDDEDGRDMRDYTDAAATAMRYCAYLARGADRKAADAPWDTALDDEGQQQ